MLLSLSVLCLLSAEPNVAVLELTPHGASAELTSAVSGAVAHELERLGVFRLTTTDSVRALLSLERQRAMLGAADGSAMLGQLASTLGADYVLHGKLSKVDSGFALELVLDDAHAGRPIGSDLERAPSASGLLDLVGKAVSKTFAALLAQRTGRLLIDASEAGAVVKLDDSAVGSTPLPGALTVPGGPHELSLEKAGFLSARKTVRVAPGEVTQQSVTLIPSEDYIAEHQGKATKMRIGAWAATGVAVVGLGTAIGFQLRASQLYGAVGQPGTFLDTQSHLESGDESYRNQATALQAQVNSSQSISYVGAGVGIAAVIGAAYLWIAGDDPGRYTRFRATVAPSVGGAQAGVSGSF